MREAKADSEKICFLPVQTANRKIVKNKKITNKKM